MARVLIVEDDKYLNKLLSDRLRLEGFDVASTLDGESAWLELTEAAGSERAFSIVLSDMLLPRMMGAELFTKIRESNDFNDLRLIAMSGIYKDPAQIEAITALHNLEGYWTKPFDMNGLVRALQGEQASESELPIEEQLTGFLKDTSIEQLLFKAYEMAFTGKLLIRSDSVEKRIYFMNGFPVAAESSAMAESLGQSLLQMGVIDTATRENVSKKMVEERWQFGQTLLRLNILTEPQLFEAMRRHTFRLLLNLFILKDGQYEFEPLQALPHHVMVLEFNPLLLVFKAHLSLYKSDFLHSLYETKQDSFPHRGQRFHQILPLLNLDKDSQSLFAGISGSEPLSSILKPIAPTKREALYRVFYVLEAIHMLKWSSTPDTNQPVEASTDFKETFVKEAEEGSNDIAQNIQARYVRTLNQNFFEILEVPLEATDIEISASYREIRYQLHPDRFGDQLNGQTKRILDDMLARIDQAYQILSDEGERTEYLRTIGKAKEDSVADSKRYLDAQNVFREGLRLLEAQKFEEASEKFSEASRLWPRGLEYDAYSLYSVIKSLLLKDNTLDAQRLTQRLRDLAYQQSSSDSCYVLLGHIYQSTQKFEQAREAYQRALQINERCDEAANALSNLGDHALKKQRLQQTVKRTQSALKRFIIFAVLFGTAGGIYFYRDWIFVKDEGVEVLPMETFRDQVPAVLVRRKGDAIKLTLQQGWTTTVPESVMKSKCVQLLLKARPLGVKSIYLNDEAEGLKVLCVGERAIHYATKSTKKP